MDLQDYKIVLYRQEDGSWVAEIPAISGCYSLMSTREEALRELSGVFQMIAEEYREKGLAVPADIPSRLARECAKLNLSLEKAMGEEGLSSDLADWPEY